MKKSDIDVYPLLERIRAQRPLIHHLTNWVTIYDCAAIVKALGASPVMAHAAEEVEDMAGIASALVLNIGTLTTPLIAAMKKALVCANTRGIPVVLDVCGAGATPFRDAACLDLLKTGKIAVIKGNASEIARVNGQQVTTQGVDSGLVEGDLQQTAVSLARARSCTVVITGPTDIVTEGDRVYRVENGHPLMAHVVGTGCMAASVIGTFAAVEKDYCRAAAAGLACFEIAAELAADTAQGPAAFKQRMFDTLYRLSEKDVTQKQRVRA